MGINFRKESFRDDFTFRNSPEHIRRFPFPFHEDSYMYAVNIEPHVVGAKGSVLENLIDVDEHYVAEMQDRALVLAEDPLRCQSLPHMTLAGWDLLELLMSEQAKGYPEHFTLTRNGDQWRWINRPLGIDDSFTFGDVSTLPYGPMEYITRQSQGDFCILDQRDGNLCAGWLACHDTHHLLALRVAHAGPEILNYSTTVPVFSSGAEARAHGMKDIEQPQAAARKMMAGLVKKGI